MAIRFTPVTTSAKPTNTREPKPVTKPVIDKPKPQAVQPVAGGGRGRKPSSDPRRMISFRLPSSLIQQLDAQDPDWKAKIETLLRTHFRPNQF